MAYTAEQQAIIDQAVARNPSNPQLAIWQFAQSIGYSPEQVDQFMGWPTGSTIQWAVGAGLAQPITATTTNAKGQQVNSTVGYSYTNSNGTVSSVSPTGSTSGTYSMGDNAAPAAFGLNQTPGGGGGDGLFGFGSDISRVINDPSLYQGLATAGALGAAGELAAANGVGAGTAATTATTTLPAATAADIAALEASTLTPTVTAGLTGAGAGLAGAAGTGLLAGTAAGSVLPAVLNTAGSLLNADASRSAAQTQADAQIKAAQIAADAAKFKPVGVTTNFGSSQFGYDANGNLTSAGYQLAPGLQAAIGTLGGQAQGLLNQAGQVQSATAPMATAAQRAMSLGQGYLATDPQAQAAKYLAEQQGLLAPGRADALAALQAQMQAQGRGGFAIGGGVNGQGAANPQLQALYNAQLQQDAQLAANATQGGMDYAKFGAGMVGTGGDMLSSMYGVQNAAYTPLNTTLNTAKGIESMGQNAMQLGMDLGSKTTAASTAAGGLLSTGMTNAANTIGTNAQTLGSNWGNLLQGAGAMTQGYRFDPMTGKPISSGGTY